MKVWIETRRDVGDDGWPITGYDVVTSEGNSVLPADKRAFSGALEAREWANERHQVMDVPRPGKP